MKTIVMKFGGSSLENTDRIKDVANLISKRKSECNNLLIVVSAMGKTTNHLIDMASSISESPDKREMDVLLATGEQISISLLAMALNAKGLESISLTGWQAGIKTYGNNTKQKIADIKLERINREHKKGKIVIVAGFQGFDKEGNISTLGRGGSDTSAVALASALDGECEIYTDVKGIYTIDPRIDSRAKLISELSYEETMEMAGLGAKIIEARAVDLAARFNVPLTIALNTGIHQGTRIMKEVKSMLEENVITNVSVVDHVVLFNIEGFGANSEEVLELFNHFSKTDVNIDVISQSFNDDISFTTKKEDLKEVRDIVARFTNHAIDYKDDVVKISVIGNGMRYQSGVAASVYEVFAKNKVKFYQVSTSEISISYIVDAKNRDKVVRALAEKFNLLESDDINE